MKKILIIGGDRRMTAAMNELKNSGFAVYSENLLEDDNGCISDADVILLPVPTTKDNLTVYSPLGKKKIYLADIENQAGERTVLSAGCKLNVKNNYDYGKSDFYALLNAVPTAEGAISLAISNTDITVWNSNVLVIGYGRVGKVLADRLKALGGCVTVSARKPADISLASALGYKAVYTETLALKPLNFDFVFNTVDGAVLTEKSFKGSKISFLCDLSSFGGFDRALAEENGIKVFNAPGLPGKTAYITAGKILARTVTDILT